MKSKKSLIIFFSVLFSCAVIFFISFIVYNFVGYYSCASAIESVPEINFEEYLRITIYGTTYSEDEKTISGTFSIMNTNGNEIAVIERSWNGAYLAVDFIHLEMKNKTFVFPLRIYGKNEIFETHPDSKKITTLDKYYNDGGQCLLNGVYVSMENRKNLFKIARFAVRRYMIFDRKYKQKITVDLSSCKTGKNYSIIRNRFGGLEIVEL